MNAFSGTAIESIIIPKNVTSMSDSSGSTIYSALYGAEKLKTVIFESGMNEIPYFALAGTSASITSVSIPDSVTRIGLEAFYNCQGLTDITMPSNLTTIDSSAFAGCTNLASVTLNTGLTSIGGQAFSGTAIDSITIPQSVITMSGTGPVFDGAMNLKTVTFESGMTTIPAYALANNTSSVNSITSVYIPPSVTSIGVNAFQGCNQMTIYCAAGSYAQIYANVNGIPCIIGEYDYSLTPGPVTPSKEITPYVTYQAGGNTNFTTQQIDGGYQSQQLNFTVSVSNGSVLYNGIYAPSTDEEKAAMTAKDVEVHVLVPQGVNLASFERVSGEDLSPVIAIVPGDTKYLSIDFGELAWDEKKSIDMTYNFTPTQGTGSFNIIVEVVSDATVYDYMNIPTQTITVSYQTPAVVLQKAAYAWVALTQAYTDALSAECAKESKTHQQATSTALASAVDSFDIELPGAPDDLITPCKQALLDVFAKNPILQTQMGNMQASADPMTAATSIVSTVRSGLAGGYFLAGRYGKYDISIDIFSAYGAFMGELRCVDSTLGSGASYPVEFNSSVDIVEKAVANYMQQVEKLAVDEYSQALSSAFTEITSLSGIQSWSSKIEGKVNDALKSQFGDINDTLGKGYQYYKYVSDVISGPVNGDMTSYANNILNETKDYAFGNTSTISDIVINNAINAMTSSATNVYAAANALKTGQPLPQATDTSTTQVLVDYNKSTIMCPVNVYVYDQNGTEIGHVVDGDVYNSASITIIVDGDIKTVYSPKDANISIKLVGTDYGMLNYTMEEYQGGQATGRLNFYNIPLYEEKELDIETPTSSLSSIKDDFTITSSNGSVNPNEYYTAQNYKYISINTNSSSGGIASPGGTYAAGDPVTLVAIPDSGYMFAGWYQGDTWVPGGMRYSFTAQEDTTLTAKFIPVPVYGDGTVTYGDVNSDGSVDLRDATLIMQYYTKLIPDSGLDLTAADVNDDGTVDLRDATLIMQYYTKLVDHLGP